MTVKLAIGLRAPLLEQARALAIHHNSINADEFRIQMTVG